MKPAVSVVIVNDYIDRECWKFIRETFQGLLAQDFQGQVEYIYVESKDQEQHIPPEILSIIPQLKVLLSNGNNAYMLKNEGVKAASADIIATLDADCVPEKNWLKKMVIALNEHPEVSIVTGMTMYKEKTLLIRTLCLLERAYVDPGGRGYTVFFEDNNAGYRKTMLIEHPFFADKGAFVGGRCYVESIKRAGHKILFEPEMKVKHVFHGFKFENDLRRNYGRLYFVSRCLDSKIRFAWFTKFGYFSIPMFMVSLLVLDWLRCIRLWGRWNLKFYEVPFAMCIAVGVRFLEIPGFIDGINRREIKATNYR